MVVQWAEIEPAKGKYDFGPLDTQPLASQIYGLYTIPRPERNLNGPAGKELPIGNSLAFQGLISRVRSYPHNPTLWVTPNLCKVQSFARGPPPELTGFPKLPLA